MGQQSLNRSGSEPRIVEFGPYRTIGISCVGKGAADFVAVWDAESGFLARMCEVDAAPGTDFAVGMCRCVPGVADGSFEYIAARPAGPDASVPKGMIEAPIAGGTYAVFPVAGLDDLMRGWNATREWLEAHPEWDSYCNEQSCDCANHPSFELYPPGFTPEGELFIYIPLRPALP